jgi:hypothetical protein
MDKNIISRNEICAKCEKEFYIGKLYVCLKCKKILCSDCMLYLSRKTDEVNFEYHYSCFDKNIIDDEPGIFVRIYNL